MNNTVMGKKNDHKSLESDCMFKRSKGFVFYCNVEKEGITLTTLLNSISGQK